MQAKTNPTKSGEREISFRPSRLYLYVLVAVGGCALDLVTKQLIFDAYFAQPLESAEQVHRWLIEPVLGIQTSTNQGALFGLGRGNSALFALLSCLAALGIFVWLFWFGASKSIGLTLALSSITGGILGNLYDRLGFWHGANVAPEDRLAVRDWIHFRWEGISFFDPWPNFNIADSLLVCGAIFIVIHTMLFPVPGQVKETDKPVSDG